MKRRGFQAFVLLSVAPIIILGFLIVQAEERTVSDGLPIAPVSPWLDIA